VPTKQSPQCQFGDCFEKTLAMTGWLSRYKTQKRPTCAFSRRRSAALRGAAEARAVSPLSSQFPHVERMMTMMNAEDIVTKLRELRPIITTRYKVKEISLFGSFVRGEQNANSDIDILAEFDEGADLFDLIGLTLYLEEILQRHVDVVPKRALRTELQEPVLREVIAV